MKIGIDLSPLQGLHRMRGVGSVLSNILSCLPENTKNNYYIFYIIPLSDGVIDPLANLKFGDMKYEIRTFSEPPRRYNYPLPWKLGLVNKAINQLVSILEFRTGQKKIPQEDLRDIDAYIQIDPTVPLPKTPKKVLKTIMVHDIIPYKIEWDYLWNFKTARNNGMGYKASLKLSLRRRLYRIKMKAVTKSADLILCNSRATRQDFIYQFKTNDTKAVVTTLGISQHEKTRSAMPKCQYTGTSWGNLKRDLMTDLSKQDFVFFVGGGDKRRKLQDLVAAFNILRSRNYDLKLVLAGDTVMGPTSIDNADITKSLIECSYQDDIIFLGYIEKQELAWLYEHTVAFVFPSRYEGFGLPVLEAMGHGAPVITYESDAIREVASNSVIYANDSLSIASSIILLIEKSKLRKDLIQNGLARSKEFPWSQTTTTILKNIQKRHDKRRL